MSSRGNSRAPPGGQKMTLCHWILRIVTYRLVQSVFRFAMTVVGKKWIFRFQFSLTYKRFHSSHTIFSTKYLYFLRLWPNFFDVKRFLERSRRSSSRVFWPRPFRWRFMFGSVTYSFWVIGEGKQLFVFSHYFFSQ